jgi:CubicO group peptidase (beta-lactamase class C family)
VLDLDAPVERYWPEFAAHGKGGVTVREALAHRAGVPAIDGDFTFEDALSWERMVDALAAQPPAWPPGTAHGYHLRTWGWLVGEIVRRASGLSPGRALAEWVTGPLGADFHVGLPARLEPRVSRVVPPEGGVDLAALLGADSLTARAASTPGGVLHYDEMWNDPRLHAAELPSSNGIGTARAVADIYAAIVGEVEGVRLVSAGALADAAVPVSEGPDAVIVVDSRYATGFMLQPLLNPGCPPSCLGHSGAGGSLGFADPEAGIGFGYVMNRMKMAMEEDRRTSGLVRALYECL